MDSASVNEMNFVAVMATWSAFYLTKNESYTVRISYEII